MKKLLTALPLVVLVATSCSKNTPAVAEALPPVVQKKETKVAKTTPTKKKSYRKSTASKPKSKPKSKSTTRSVAKKTTKPKTSSSSSSSSSKPTVTTTKKETVSPLIPDPARVAQVTEIPVFKVPDNIQPSIPDGINQAEFIELKW